MYAFLTATSAFVLLVPSTAGLAIDRRDQTPISLPSGWSYQGCLVHVEEGPRSVIALADDEEMTHEVCARFCASKGHEAAGISHGTDCYCWSSPNLGFIRMSDELCRLPCSGDPSEICGGRETFSVISTLKSSQTELRSESFVKRSKCGGKAPASPEHAVAPPAASGSASGAVQPGANGISPIYLTVGPWAPTESSNAIPSEDAEPSLGYLNPEHTDRTKTLTPSSAPVSPFAEDTTSEVPAAETGAPFPAVQSEVPFPAHDTTAVLPAVSPTSGKPSAIQSAEAAPADDITSFGTSAMAEPTPEVAPTDSITSFGASPMAEPTPEASPVDDTTSFGTVPMAEPTPIASFVPIEVVDPLSPTDFSSVGISLATLGVPISSSVDVPSTTTSALALESSDPSLGDTVSILGDAFSVTAVPGTSQSVADPVSALQSSSISDAFPVLGSIVTASVLPVETTESPTVDPTSAESPAAVAASPVAAAMGACSTITGTYILQGSNNKFGRLQPASGSGHTVSFDAAQADAQDFLFTPDCSFTTADGSMMAMVGGTAALSLYEQYFFTSLDAANQAIPGAWESDYCFMNDDDTLNCSAMMQSVSQMASATNTTWLVGVQNEGIGLTITLVSQTPI